MGSRDLDRRAARSVRLVVVRQVVVLCVTFAGSVALARLLDPAEFGLFAIATFFVETFGLLAYTAMPQALIQRRGRLTDDELQVAFTLQQLFATVAVVGWVLNRDEFLAAAAGAGPRLVREFLCDEAPDVRGAPEQFEARGFLFASGDVR